MSEHWQHGIEALPDFGWLVWDEIEKCRDPVRIAELEEAIKLYEAWLEGRTVEPTL